MAVSSSPESGSGQDNPKLSAGSSSTTDAVALPPGHKKPRKVRVPDSTLRFLDWFRSEYIRPFGRRGGVILIIAVTAWLAVEPVTDYNIIDTYYASPQEDFQHNRFVHLMAKLASGGIVIGAILSTWVLYIRSRDAFDSDLKQHKLAELKEKERQVRDKSTATFAELYDQNQERIDYYHGLATRQSKESFRSGQIATFIGFSLTIVIGVIAGFAPNGTAAVAASVVAVAAAALSGFIGATSMKSQTEASKQLRDFFLQPVEFARALNAERLLQDMPPDHKVEATRDIIRGVVSTPKDEAKKEEPKP